MSQRDEILDSLVLCGTLDCRMSRETWFRVHEDRDKEEGKDPQPVKYIVQRLEDAKVLAYGLGVRGEPGKVTAVSYLRLELLKGSGSYLLSADPPVSADIAEKHRLRAQAMAKLTPAELEALLNE